MSKKPPYGTITTPRPSLEDLNKSSTPHQSDIDITASSLPGATRSNDNSMKLDTPFDINRETNQSDPEDGCTNIQTHISNLLGNNNIKRSNSISNLVSSIHDDKLGSDSEHVGSDSVTGNSDSDTCSNSSEINESFNNENKMLNTDIEFNSNKIKKSKQPISEYNNNHEPVTKNNKHSSEISELEKKEERLEEMKENLENSDKLQEIHYKGHMLKERPGILSWPELRFFVLRWDGTLTWYKTKIVNKKLVLDPRNTLNLSSCKRIIKCKNNACFILEIKDNINKEMGKRIFTCNRCDERDKWIQKILEVYDNVQYVEESLQTHSTYRINFLKYADFFLSKISRKIDKSKLKDHELATAINCCHLSNYVYNPTNELLDKRGFKEVYPEKQNKSTDLPPWRIVIDKNHRPGQTNDTIVYIVFKGTSIEQPKDCIIDISIGPTPFDFFEEIKMESMSSKQIEEQRIHVHGGMYCAMRQYYCQITKKLQKMLKSKIKFKKIVVTGHSLGGGIGILFCLNLLKYKYLMKQNNLNTFLNDIDFFLITFGAPCVIVPNKNLNKSGIGLEILKIFSENSIHVVNKLDVVPRIFLTDNWGRKMLQHWIKLKSNSIVKILFDLDSHTKKLDQFLSKIEDRYKPLGTFCFLQENKILWLIKNLDTIEEILNYHPPVMSNNKKLWHKHDDKKTCCLDLHGYRQILKDHLISSYMRALNNYKNNMLINKM